MQHRGRPRSSPPYEDYAAYSIEGSYLQPRGSHVMMMSEPDLAYGGNGGGGAAGMQPMRNGNGLLLPAQHSTPQLYGKLMPKDDFVLCLVECLK